ncbi:MAG: FAD-binding protein, partial [Cyclobacteriaceae bacterium]|nr:FAD-binding protein [Cyclobacteriaceae bacterium]
MIKFYKSFLNVFFEKMQIIEKFDLLHYNTFGIKATAKYFVEINHQEDIFELIKSPVFKNNQHIILGGGSNVLFLNDYFDGMVIHINNKGISIVEENDSTLQIEVQAGEIWHDFVLYTINHQWGGIENLSLIPGKVGAAPMQNIGAYGVEVKDCIDSVKAIDIETGKMVSLPNERCEFGYRTSVFKTHLKNKYIIASVIFNLDKKRKVNISYGMIKEKLEEKGIFNPSIKDVSQA